MPTAPPRSDEPATAWAETWQRLTDAGVDEHTPMRMTCAQVMGFDAHLGRDRWPGCSAPVTLGLLVPAWNKTCAPAGLRPLAKCRALSAAPSWYHYCAACTARYDGVRITRTLPLDDKWVEHLLAARGNENAPS